MIPITEINRAAKQFGLAAEIIEKDYMICWLLIGFSRSRLRDDFTFYGGTAIKRIYFDEHRYSEDIDLIASNSFKPQYILDKLGDSFLYAKNEANITFTLMESELIYQDKRLQIPVSYDGFDEIIGAPKRIQVDFSMDRASFGDSEQGQIIESYSDLPHHCKPIRTHSINTILANKIGMLVDTTRYEPRDLYDIWFFLKHCDEFELNMNAIKSTIKQKYSFIPSFALLRNNLKSETYRKMWNIRLEKQMNNLPHIELVLNEVNESLEQLF